MGYTFELGGVPVVLRYTVNAMCAAEELAGGSIENIMTREFTAARLLLWAGLCHDEPRLTPEEAGERIDLHIAAGGCMEEVVKACVEGMRVSGFFPPSA